MAERVTMSVQAFVNAQGNNQLAYVKDESAIHADQDAGVALVNFSDSDLDAGIVSFPTFLNKINSGIYLKNFARDFVEGMSYVVHKGNIINNITTSASGNVLDASQGKVLKDEIDLKVNKSSIVNNLTTRESGSPLDAYQGYRLDQLKIDKANINNNVSTTVSGYVLDARQGKTLKDEIDTKIPTANIVNRLNETTAGKVLDAYQGYMLDTNKVSKSQIINNLNKTVSGDVLDAYQGYLLDTNKVNKSQIADNLTQTASGKVLDARQGKILDDRITSEISTVNSSISGLSQVVDGKLSIVNLANNLSTTASGYGLDARQGKVIFDSISHDLATVVDINSTATENIAANKFFIYYDPSYGIRLCKTLRNISIDEAFVLGTNYEYHTDWFNQSGATSAFSVVIDDGVGYFYKVEEPVDPLTLGNAAFLSYEELGED